MTVHEDRDLTVELAEAMRGLKVLTKIKALKDCDSTNTFAASLLADDKSSAILVAAAKQVKGRGRFDRTWLMSDGDVACSVILRAPHLPQNLALLPMIPGLAIVNGLKKLGVEARLKWPNDIIVKDQSRKTPHRYFADFVKVGGILCENIFKENQVVTCIMGFGLNIVKNEQLLDAVEHAGFLQDFCDQLTRQKLYGAVLPELDALLNDISQADFEARVLKDYSGACETLGRQVFFKSQGQTICGQAESIEKNGALVVNDGTKKHKVFAGDINFLSN